MTTVRWILVASVFGGVAFDVVRQGSEEYACKSEIARVEQEIDLLRQRRADLQVGLQQRLMARMPIVEFDLGAPIVHTEVPRRSTLWEQSAQNEGVTQRAFASEEVPDTRLTLADWIDAR